jgi:hypothetical protein
MPLASLEEMESNDTTVSTNGDRVFDLVREGKMNCTIFQFFLLCLNSTKMCMLI